MRVAVVGDRSIEDRDWVTYNLDQFIGDIKAKENQVTIVSGGSKGVDSIAKDYAEAEGYDFILFKPYHLVDNKMEFTPRFFFTRNKQIVDNSDFIIIFANNDEHMESGTRSVFRYCQKRDKPMIVLTPEQAEPEFDVAEGE